MQPLRKTTPNKPIPNGWGKIRRRNITIKGDKKEMPTKIIDKAEGYDV